MSCLFQRTVYTLVGYKLSDQQVLVSKYLKYVRLLKCTNSFFPETFVV